MYLPASRVRANADFDKAKIQIKQDLKERIQTFLEKCDHNFAISNFNYVQDWSENDVVKDIYKKLGPFDHFEHRDTDGPTNEDENRHLRFDFDERKSGALYRGQQNEATLKPDGFGFKIYPNGAIFEGFFVEGQINGFGRGVTPKGEVYQGRFEFDAMNGEGLFQWPDGRMYFGNFSGGRKNGSGVFMWPNGQIYEGEFKGDDCNGAGVLYYPDGKKFDGLWRDGKKHGKGSYVWPNGARFTCVYADGKKKEQGKLEGSKVSLEELKDQYGSLLKKSQRAKEHQEMAVQGMNNFHRAGAGKF
jgi:hypothetical protein